MTSAPHPPQRRHLWRVVPTLLAAVIALLLAPVGIAAATTTTTAATMTGAGAPSDGEVIGGIDVGAATTDLSGDHLAVIDSRADPAALAAVVGDARRQGLQLSLLVTGTEMSTRDTYDLAQALGNAVGGTVLVLAGNTLDGSSADISASELTAALQAARGAGLDDVAAARAFVASAADTPRSSVWLFVGAGVVVVLLVGAVVLARRRTHARSTGGLAELTEHLRERSGRLAPLVLSMSERVEAVGRPDLEARFDRASADYSTLQADLAAPLPDRPSLDAATERTADLERRLDALDRELDAIAPGMEPPSPAG